MNDFSQLGEYVDEAIARRNGRLQIRDLGAIAHEVTQATDINYLRMDIGVPGLRVPVMMLDAHNNAAGDYNLSQYPHFAGIEALRVNAANFVNYFSGTDISPAEIVATVGAMQAGNFALQFGGHINPHKKGVLFLTPGFSLNVAQARNHGLEIQDLDTRNLWGENLVDVIETRLKLGNIGTVMYSSPCNPSWQTRTTRELEGMAKLGDKYDVIWIEDNAYYGYDSRQPGLLDPTSQALVPSILYHAKHAIGLFSASKTFSGAGLRIGFAAITPDLATRDSQELERLYGYTQFREAFIRAGPYQQSAGAAVPSQLALAAILDATRTGNFSITDHLAPYTQSAAAMKPLFEEAGFEIAYAHDGLDGEKTPIGDGFYFTVTHPKYKDELTLVRNLLASGLTAVPLAEFQAEIKGLRICTSLVRLEDMSELRDRLGYFHEQYGNPK